MKDVLSLCSSSSFRLQIVVDFDEIKEVLSLLMQPEKNSTLEFEMICGCCKTKEKGK